MDKSSQAISEIMEEGSAAGWLVTYADLMTLLLTFFILLFSISTMNLEKFKQAISAIQISLGEKSPPIGLLDLIVEIPEVPLHGDLAKPTSGGHGPKETKIALEDVIGLKSRDIFRDVQHFIHKSNLSNHILLSIEGSKVIIRVTGKVLFKSGNSVLNPEALPILDDIVKIAGRHPEYYLRIEGHSDNVPISTPQFPSNWELSAVRATSVLRYLVDGGMDPHRLTATGYGSLLPLFPNDTESNRARNRRVEFVLEKKEK
jgi:chemotaxis protein MotB